jgi:hypothetical protein
VRGKAAELGEGCQKVRLGQDSFPNIAISAAETSGKWGRCFTHTPSPGWPLPSISMLASKVKT